MKNTKNISKLSGFKTPKGYFDSFSVDVKAASQNKAGFKVPENYFESFEVKAPKPSKVIRLYHYKSVAVAAVLIVILGTMLINLINVQQADENLDFSKIDRNQLFDYIEDEMYLDHDLYISNNAGSPKSSTIDLSSDEVLEYLDETSIEQLIDD
jgi:hypothetical protein